MEKTKILFIRFTNVLSHYEIEAFRGAIVQSLTDRDILFHNHLTDSDGFRYSYPLIQYKRINRQAVILCLELGTEAVAKLFAQTDFDLNLNGKPVKFEIDNIKAYNHLIQIWESKFHFRIRKWLALNQENYEKYTQLEGVVEKSQFLENILRGNILSFAKGLNVFFDKQVECKITWLGDPAITRYKGVKMTMFDAEFITNVSIPDYVGLGKGVSIGHGVTVRKREKNNQ